MAHNHNHHSAAQAVNLNRAFLIGIAVNLIYVLIEAASGFYYNSLSLISDAGHNLSDVAALALALLAFRLSRVKRNDKFTYGYRKSTILVSLINAVVLFIVIGGILWESISRLGQPVVIAGKAVAIIAGIGIFINAFSAMLFFKNKESDLNVKGAYLHLMADALVSLGVVISGVLMYIFHIYWLDMVMSLIIVSVIFYSTWNLFKESLSLTLDGVPKGINLDQLISKIKEVDNVLDVHHLHVWSISTSQNALTVHITTEAVDLQHLSSIKKNVKHLLEHQNIHHVTIEFETADEICEDKNKL